MIQFLFFVCIETSLGVNFGFQNISLGMSRLTALNVSSKSYVRLKPNM